MKGEDVKTLFRIVDETTDNLARAIKATTKVMILGYCATARQASKRLIAHSERLEAAIPKLEEQVTCSLDDMAAEDLGKAMDVAFGLDDAPKSKRARRRAKKKVTKKVAKKKTNGEGRFTRPSA
jgi:dienelactone hydrolase